MINMKGKRIDWTRRHTKLALIIRRIRTSEAEPEDWHYLQTFYPAVYAEMLKYVCLRNVGYLMKS